MVSLVPTYTPSEPVPQGSPKLSFSNHVNTESRYGMCSSAFFFLPPLAGSADAAASAAITLPSVVSDLLMLAPSLRRAPVAPVELARSEPARSTRLREGTEESA